jgi:acetolactate synthase regulatory subunit
MTAYTLHVTFEAQEGAMLRIMGLIHRRGFEVSAIDMPQGIENGLKSAAIMVEPKGAGFRIETLQKQIERLIEVREVRSIEPQRRRNILSFLRRTTAESGARA